MLYRMRADRAMPGWLVAWLAPAALALPGCVSTGPVQQAGIDPPAASLDIAAAPSLEAAAEQADRTAALPSPQTLYGPLFDAVQTRRLYEDPKDFTDALPLREPERILADYRALAPMSDARLRQFIAANFDLSVRNTTMPTARDDATMVEHIEELWPVLARPPQPQVTRYASDLPLPAPFVVPGGIFQEMYYWDSYFTMLGLARDGRDDLVEGMIDNFGALVERYGHVPNGTRTYFLSRSQPPFFALMAGLSKVNEPAVLRRRLGQLQAEHAFWMAGSQTIGPGAASRRVVALPDGALLNRYRDDRDTPRDESWANDLETAAAAGSRERSEVFRDIRSAAESGWDFSSRWFGDGRTLATIRTTAIIPVDLNALLYALEEEIAARCTTLGDAVCARTYVERAAARKAAMTKWLWNEPVGAYLDYDWQARRPTGVLSAATLFPLFTGAASPEQAEAVARLTSERLIAPGGLRTTLSRTGQQWDAPNGWAPLQWVAVSGLGRYGHDVPARMIAERFLATTRRVYRETGKMLEKYDVEEARPGGGGEYALQDGFGWTNGVVRELIARYGDFDPSVSMEAENTAQP